MELCFERTIWTLASKISNKVTIKSEHKYCICTMESNLWQEIIKSNIDLRFGKMLWRQ